MPSEEWFRENPKVSAYISRELHQKLETWMEDNGVKKVSQALTEILEAFLEPSKADDQQDALMTLEQKFEDRFAALESRVITIDLAIAKIQGSSNLVQISDKQQLSFFPELSAEQPEPATEIRKEDSSLNINQDKLNSRMTNREVSDFTGLSYSQVKGRHGRGTMIEEKGKTFTPIKEADKPMWNVQDT